MAYFGFTIIVSLLYNVITAQEHSRLIVKHEANSILNRKSRSNDGFFEEAKVPLSLLDFTVRSEVLVAACTAHISDFLGV